MRNFYLSAPKKVKLLKKFAFYLQAVQALETKTAAAVISLMHMGQQLVTARAYVFLFDVCQVDGWPFRKVVSNLNIIHV